MSKFVIDDKVIIKNDLYVDCGVWRKGALCQIISIVINDVWYRIKRIDLPDDHNVFDQGYYRDAVKIVHIAKIGKFNEQS